MTSLEEILLAVARGALPDPHHQGMTVESNRHSLGLLVHPYKLVFSRAEVKHIPIEEVAARIRAWGEEILREQERLDGGGS